MGSFVMILMVPPTALAPNKADPPPRTTSTRSIIFTGICSKPYTPDRALTTGPKSTGVTYPLGLDPGADIFAKYALRDAGITRNVLIDREGKIVKLTRLYNEEEFASLVQQINEMLK